MAGISTVGGIVIPISIVRTGDKAAIANLKREIGGLSSVVVKTTKTVKGSKAGLESWNKQLNLLRWSMVNVTFAMTAMAGVAMPWILATKNAAEYENQLVRIQSVTAELPGLTSATILGAKAGRPFGKADVAAGYLEFSKAGFTAAESASALNSILDLSIVGFMDVNAAAQLTAQMIRAFNLEATDASHIMDVMSNVADSSKIDVDTLGIALGYVATIAHSAGQSLEDTSVILGVLADAGLNGSKAGTSLRQVIAALIDPSDKAKKAMRTLGISFVDSSGNVKSMTAFLEELKRSLVGFDPGRQQELLGQMFEVRALAGVSAAINRLDDLGGSFDGLLVSAEASGTAMVKAMQQQESAVNQMKSAMEAFKDAFTGTGDVMLERTGAVTSAMETLGKGLGKITHIVAVEFLGAFQSTGTAIVSILAGIATAALVAVGPIGWGFAAVTAGVAGLLGMGGVFSLFSKDVEDHGISWSKVGAELKNSSAETNAFIGNFRSIPGLATMVEEEFGNAGSAITSNLKELDKLTAKSEEYAKIIPEANIAAKMAESEEETAFFNEEVKRLVDEFLKVNEQINNIKEATVGFADTNMKDFIADVKEAYNAFISLDSIITILKKDLDEDIFGKLLGTKKFTKTSDTLESFINNIKVGIEDVRVNAANLGDIGIISDEELNNLNTAETLLNGYMNSIKSAESALQTLNLTRETQEGLVKNAKVLYNDEKKELQTLNSQYSQLTKTINELSGARFKGETKTLGIIGKVNNLIKQQELASYGVADANQFIIDSLKLESSDYDTLLGQISKINNEMVSNTGSFKAWQETIKQAILAEVEAGQTLGEDVSARVKTWQTALLGISGTGVGEGAKSEAAEFANKLQLAYDVHFGGMKDEVGNFLAEQKDREVGVFDTSSQLINSISEEIVKREALALQIDAQESIVSAAFTDLNTKTGELNSTISQITDKKEEIKASVTAIEQLTTAAGLFKDGLIEALVSIKQELNKAFIPAYDGPSFVELATIQTSLESPVSFQEPIEEFPRLGEFVPEVQEPVVPGSVPFAGLINKIAELSDKAIEPIRNVFEIREMIVNANNPDEFADEIQTGTKNE